MTLASKRYRPLRCQDILLSVAHPSLLVFIFSIWAVASVAVGAVLLQRAPAVSLAIFGSLLGAVAGFLVGNADGPAEVPAYTAVGASVGLVSNGVMGMLTTSARPPSGWLRRAALLVLSAIPFSAAALTLLVRFACPLYVSGKGSGFCNYQGIDVLGGWVSGVIVAFVFDGVFVAGLLLLSSWQAGLAFRGGDDLRRRLSALVYSGVVAVLGGEPAVPCTRNPLQRG